MPPLIKHSRHESDEVEAIHDLSKDQDESEGPEEEFVPTIVWRNVIIMGSLHAAAAYGLYLCFTSAMIKTSVLGMLSPCLPILSSLNTDACFSLFLFAC